MKVVAVIPARYGSTRLPGKPLLAESGKPLVQHVWEGVREAEGLSEVLIATDDERISRAARGFGATAVMTRADHPSGTDRIREAVGTLADPPDIVVNVQCDEPETAADDIAALLDLLAAHPGADIATLAFSTGDGAIAAQPARVKVACAGPFALYFSRAPIPFPRSGNPVYRIHVGLYAYRRQALERFVTLPPSPLERAECLEQLRALEAGMTIAVGRSERLPRSIDTPDDYRDFLARMRGTPPAP